MKTITTKYVWTDDDLITGRKYALKLKKWSSIRYWAVFFPSVAVGFLAFGPHRARHDILATSIIGGVILIGMLIGVPLAKWISRCLMRRQFSKRPDSGTEVVWEISEAGITTSTADSKSQSLWSAFHLVVSTPEGFLFMPNAEIFFFIPNRAFENKMEIERLKDLVRRSTMKFKECA